MPTWSHAMTTPVRCECVFKDFHPIVKDDAGIRAAEHNSNCPVYTTAAKLSYNFWQTYEPK